MEHAMTKFTFPSLAMLALSAALISPASAQTGEPSRPAQEGCAWEKLSDAKVGLSAWVERCNFGDRKIDLHFQGILSFSNIRMAAMPSRSSRCSISRKAKPRKTA
jgi:hypothetical protein